MSQESSLARVRELLNKMDAAQSIDAEIQIIEALQSAVTPALLRKLVEAYDELHCPSHVYAGIAASLEGANENEPPECTCPAKRMPFGRCCRAQPGPSSTACDDQFINAGDTEGGSHD